MEIAAFGMSGCLGATVSALTLEAKSIAVSDEASTDAMS
ncbi:Uncharacterized protein ToN1_34110 [Aromatoleum petrolei]|nr:Uncharacterized protein ToN1_34110 [Aromatoleum petrolei]